MRLAFLLVFAAAILISASSLSSAETGLNCATTVPGDELTICKTPELAAKQRLDDQAFAKLAQQPDLSWAAANARDEFLAARRKCGIVIGCIRRAQDAFLAVAAKLADPTAQPSADKPQPSEPGTTGPGQRSPRPLSSSDKTPAPPLVALRIDGGGGTDALRWVLAVAAVAALLIGALPLSRRALAALDDLRAVWAKPAAGDKRRARRRVTRRRTGMLFDFTGLHLASCTVIDRSDTGAKIKAATPIAPIDVMRFRDDVDGRTYLSKVAWRNGDEFGIMFLGKSPT
jgi:hypothetical protein